MAAQTSTRAGVRLAVDWTACDGRGLCAELLPELVKRDEWGFPLIRDAVVGPALLDHARRAIAACPTLALRLEPSRPPVSPQKRR
jgi:ferredoxin